MNAFVRVLVIVIGVLRRNDYEHRFAEHEHNTSQ